MKKALLLFIFSVSCYQPVEMTEDSSDTLSPGAGPGLHLNANLGKFVVRENDWKLFGRNRESKLHALEYISVELGKDYPLNNNEIKILSPVFTGMLFSYKPEDNGNKVYICVLRDVKLGEERDIDSETDCYEQDVEKNWVQKLVETCVSASKGDESSFVFAKFEKRQWGCKIKEESEGDIILSSCKTFNAMNKDSVEQQKEECDNTENDATDTTESQENAIGGGFAAFLTSFLTSVKNGESK